MGRSKVLVAGPGFIHLDDDESGRQGGGAKDVEEKVCEGAGAFLVGGVRGLEDEGGLDSEEEAGLQNENKVSMIRLS